MTEINNEINLDILCSNSREMAIHQSPPTCISATKKFISNDQLLVNFFSTLIERKSNII